MPLHLLGKKSWNVYNADNIARVRRDEAAAKAAEEAEEQRMQEVDAQRRLAILRGEEPPPLPETEDTKSTETERHANDDRLSHPAGGRRKRKRPGEDDTEFELRLANDKLEPSENDLHETRKSTSSAPITDRAGNIDLFGDERARAHAQKNEEAEKESKKKKQELEDQYRMRFSNAAGRSGLNNPWYSQSGLAAVERPSKDVWGNEDPKRKERDTQRIVANDPLAMMKTGASKVRELKQERKKFQEEREEELRQLRKEQRHRERHRRVDRRDLSPRESERRRHQSRHRQDDGAREDRERRWQRDRGDDRRHRYRSRSRSPGHRRHRHRHET